jgi:hypothetical protein
VATYLTFIIQLFFTISDVNMAAPFIKYTKEGQQRVTRFLWDEGVKGADTK